MPIYKFRHVADMKDTAWRQPGDPALFRAIRATWTLADRTARAPVSSRSLQARVERVGQRAPRGLGVGQFRRISRPAKGSALRTKMTFQMGKATRLVPEKML